MNSFVSATEVRTMKKHLDQLTACYESVLRRISNLEAGKTGRELHLPNPFRGKIIYIAGKLSGDVALNTGLARHYALQVANRGHCPFVPHTALDYLTDWRHAMRLCLVLLHECQGILMTPGWQDSTGSVIEWYVAHALGLTVYYAVDDIPAIQLLPDDLEEKTDIGI